MLYINFFYIILLKEPSLGGGSGRRVGLKIQSGSNLVPVQVRLKANKIKKTFVRGSFLFCLFYDGREPTKRSFVFRFSASEQRLKKVNDEFSF